MKKMLNVMLSSLVVLGLGACGNDTEVENVSYDYSTCKNVYFDSIAYNQLVYQSVLGEFSYALEARNTIGIELALEDVYNAVDDINNFWENRTYVNEDIYTCEKAYKDATTDTLLNLKLYNDNGDLVYLKRAIESMKVANKIEKTTFLNSENEELTNYDPQIELLEDLYNELK